MKNVKLVLAAVLILASAPSLFASSYTTVDLSPYVNLGFENSWFINGFQFAPIVGTTNGNQGSVVPFNVANVADSSGQGGFNNFWFGLWDVNNQLFGSPLTVTIPVNIANATRVYTLADNTFGRAGANEFSITFTPTVGASVTFQYVGSDNTKDYNLNCGTNGCDPTPNAQDWFVDQDGTQYLQTVGWDLPSNFGTLASVTVTQLDGSDGAILAGLTVETTQAPEPSTLALTSLALGGFAIIYGRRRLNLGRSRS